MFFTSYDWRSMGNANTRCTIINTTQCGRLNVAQRTQTLSECSLAVTRKAVQKSQRLGFTIIHTRCIPYSHGKKSFVAQAVTFLLWQNLFLAIVVRATARVQFYFRTQIIVVICNITRTTPVGTRHSNTYAVDTCNQSRQSNNVIHKAHVRFKNKNDTNRRGNPYAESTYGIRGRKNPLRFC